MYMKTGDTWCIQLHLASALCAEVLWLAARSAPHLPAGDRGPRILRNETRSVSMHPQIHNHNGEWESDNMLPFQNECWQYLRARLSTSLLIPQPPCFHRFPQEQLIHTMLL